MFDNRYSILSISVLLIIVIMCVIIFSLKYSKKKESFSSTCNIDCNNNLWDSYFKTGVDGSSLKCSISDGCPPSEKERLGNAWDSKKVAAMMPYYNYYNSYLKGASFQFNHSSNYLSSLINVRNTLNTGAWSMIDNIKKSQWGFPGEGVAADLDNRYEAIKQQNNVLNELISAYQLINTYYKIKVSDLNDLNYNTDFKPMVDRFYNYFNSNGDYSDKYSDLGGNTHRSSNTDFWKAIDYTHHMLQYLGDLILKYQGIMSSSSIPDLGTMRNSMKNYEGYFTGGRIKQINVNNYSRNHVYKYFKTYMDGYAGDKYLPNNVIQDSNITDSSLLARKVRETAYNNYFYENLGNCNNLYNDIIDNWSQTTTRFDSMNDAKTSLETSYFNSDTEAQKSSVNKAKDVFWNDSTSTWRPNLEESNYSQCNMVVNGQINNTPSSVFNFKDYSDNVELRRKQIQYARRDVYSSMYGEDVVSQNISESLSVCPVVDNQENLPITSWVRSEDSNQANECLSKDSFQSEKSSYRIGTSEDISGKMKAGYIVNGQDIWIDNYRTMKEKVNQLKTITGNSFNYNSKDTTHTDLMRQSGSLMGEILKDRDWNLSTYEWENINSNKDTNNSIYFVNKYLEMFNSLKLMDSPIYDFELSFIMNGNEMVFRSSLILVNSDDSNTTVSNIQVKSSVGHKGCIRLYKNMYQYTDYLTEMVTSISLPTIKGVNSPILSVIYNNLTWDLDEMIHYGYDINIICSKIQDHNDIYSSSNGFLYYHSDSQFGKLYFGSKDDNNRVDDDFKWTLVKNSSTNTYMIYNKNSKTFLGLGIYYRLESNYDLSTGIPIANENLNDNLEIRENTLYFLSLTDFETYKNSDDYKDNITYTGMLNDCSWYIKSLGNNQYTITHITGRVLWFTSNSFQLSTSSSTSSDSDSVSAPLTSVNGYINFTDPISQETEEEQQNISGSYCDKSSTSDCYNVNFYFAPSSPEDITPSLSVESLPTNLFSQCSNQQGNNTLTNSKWFRVYNSDNKYSYADINNPQQNEFSNLYQLYGNGQNYESGVLSLTGGGGNNCATSNFCHVSKSLLTSDTSDKNVNSVIQTSQPSNKQAGSKNMTVSYKNKNNNNRNKTVSVPLRKYNYKCARNEINIYKLYGNQLKQTFDSTKNPNLETIQDDSYADNDSNRKIALKIYSTNSQYIEGRDFGIFPGGTSIWFRNVLDNGSDSKTYLNYSKLRLITGNANTIFTNYVTLANIASVTNLISKQKLLFWDDRLKFKYAGFDCSEQKVYAYNNQIIEVPT